VGLTVRKDVDESDQTEPISRNRPSEAVRFEQRDPIGLRGILRTKGIDVKRVNFAIVDRSTPFEFPRHELMLRVHCDAI
jgi:hypothetical protein